MVDGKVKRGSLMIVAHGHSATLVTSHGTTQGSSKLRENTETMKSAKSGYCAKIRSQILG